MGDVVNIRLADFTSQNIWQYLFTEPEEQFLPQPQCDRSKPLLDALNTSTSDLQFRFQSSRGLIATVAYNEGDNNSNNNSNNNHNSLMA